MGYEFCQKTWTMKSFFKKKDWRENGEIAGVLSNARRTHCGCHEVGSFAFSDRYFEAIKELK